MMFMLLYLQLLTKADFLTRALYALTHSTTISEYHLGVLESSSFFDE